MPESTTDQCLDNVIALLHHAKDNDDPVRRAQILTDAQHQLAWALRWAVTDCQQAGQPWRTLGTKIGLPHGVLYRQVTAAGPVVAAEPHHNRQLRVAVGFRTVDDDQLHVLDQARATGLDSTTIFFDPAEGSNGRSPYAQRDIEFYYEWWPITDLANLGRARPYPLWMPEFGRRPLHMTEDVFDELFGSPEVGSPAWSRWRAAARARDHAHLPAPGTNPR